MKKVVMHTCTIKGKNVIVRLLQKQLYMYESRGTNTLCIKKHNVFPQRVRDYPSELDNYEKLGSNSLPLM